MRGADSYGVALVLIVEPDAELRLLAQESVRELGHQAFARARCPREIDADLLLLCGGAEVCEEIRAIREAGGSLPVICAGTAPPTDAALIADRVTYLIKPYSLKELDRAIGRALAPPQPRDIMTGTEVPLA